MSLEITVSQAAGAASINGGGRDNTGTYAATWADAMGLYNGSIFSDSSCTAGNNGSGKVRITTYSNCSACKVGVLANMDFSNINYDDGRYVITAVDVSGGYFDLDLDFPSYEDDTVECVVGGALDALSDACGIVTAGDTCYIQGGTAYTTNDGGAILYCDTAGSSTAYITYRGFETLPNDAGKCDIDCDDSVALGVYAQSYNQYINMSIHNATGDGINNGNADNINIYNCNIYSNGGDGIELDDNIHISNCNIYGNTAYGVNNDYYTLISNSKIYGNLGIQVFMNCGTIDNCIIYGSADNTGSLVRIALASNAYPFMMTNSVIDGDLNAAGTHCLYFATASGHILLNKNIVINAKGTGIAASGSQPIGSVAGFDNIIHGCGTAINNIEVDYISDDPLFVNESTHDYRLTTSSPAYNGTTGEIIGALAIETPSGGGGGVVVPQGLHCIESGVIA